MISVMAMLCVLHVAADVDVARVKGAGTLHHLSSLPRAKRIQARGFLSISVLLLHKTRKHLHHQTHIIVTRMPPRIPSHRLPPQPTCQCFRTRPSVLHESSSTSHGSSSATTISTQQTRDFHRQPGTKATRQRRDMWEWLNGPGKVFRDPLPSSTNYMSAYDKYGNLSRLERVNNSDRRGQAIADAPEVIDVAPVEQEEAIQEEERKQGLDEATIAKNVKTRAKQREDKVEMEARGGMVKERLNDMRPFPLNENFRSERVLSEELREEVYAKVVGAGVDISTVSAAFGIDLRRVAAVVRLKTIEKSWEAEVSCHRDTVPLVSDHTQTPPHDDDEIFRLVLKTTTWLLTFRSYLIGSHLYMATMTHKWKYGLANGACAEQTTRQGVQ